jgi:2,4-dienoyl-CoA reductase-like NADH-dependent reductase (Old Yellow Enzyme family)
VKLSLQPTTIGNIIVPNRFVLSPINSSFGDESGKVTKRLIDFHRKIAEGGVGLSIVGSTSVCNSGRVNYNGLVLDCEEKIENFAGLFKAIDQSGSVPAIQLMHAGRQTYPNVTRSKVYAPSKVPSPFFHIIPQPLKPQEIEDIAKQFAKSAFLAKEAGAKIVELHGAHGYLIGQFLSPTANKRQDKYGGSLENRFRFFREILKTVKYKVGADYPVICRIGVDDYTYARVKREESVAIAALLQETGADGISVSAGIYGQTDKIYPPNLTKCKNRLMTTREMRKQIQIPVIYGGGITSFQEAERVLQSTKADMIGIARSIIADPKFVVNSINKRPIITCNRCNYCRYNFRKYEALRCSVNPSL